MLRAALLTSVMIAAMTPSFAADQFATPHVKREARGALPPGLPRVHYKARTTVVYQPAPHETYFNHAHNEYLQLLSEGGVLLAVPAVIALVAAVNSIRSRLAADRTPLYWVRAGAVSGMIGAAVQSLWETGLRRPANALLFAVLAAFAMHSAAQPARRADDDTTRVRERQ